MPIYEYKCKDCGEHFEKRLSVNDEPLKTCEKCGGGLEKQWSLSGFQFKGEGWYVTDYSPKKGADAAKTDGAGNSEKHVAGEKSSGGESTASTDTASKTKSETKSEAKPEKASKSD